MREGMSLQTRRELLEHMLPQYREASSVERRGKRNWAMRNSEATKEENIWMKPGDEEKNGEAGMESFETYRSYLFAVAYRMLGSTMDAEDMVQETYLRYQKTPPQTIQSLKAFLTTIISRLCVDQLHLARRAREEYIGPWLPEPISAAYAPELVQVEERVDQEESISLAFLVLLEQLPPFERAVFLLREVFEYEYHEIATFLNKSDDACRQWYSRAKKHLRERRPRFTASANLQRRLLISFQQAVHAGDMAALINLLTEQATFWGNGGGKVPGATLHPIAGRMAIAQFFLETGKLFRGSLPEGFHQELTEVNGQPALVTRIDSRALAVMTIEVEDGQIRTLRVVSNPEKLTHV